MDYIDINITGILSHIVYDGKTYPNIIHDLSQGMHWKVTRVVKDTESKLPAFSCSLDQEMIELAISDEEYAFMLNTIQVYHFSFFSFNTYY